MSDPADPAAVHRTQLKVRFYELDPYDHLNHTVYIAYFETARIEYLESVGWGLKRLDDAGYRIVVSQIEVDFVKPVVHGDTVAVETWVIEHRRASMRWRQRMLRGDATMAVLELVAAVTDSGGRPTRIPQELLTALT